MKLSLTRCGTLALVVVLTGCSAGTSGDAADVGQATSAASEAPLLPESPSGGEESAGTTPEAPTLPPGATPGLDDLNDDGAPDPTCGTHDYGAGLVLRLLCNLADYASPPTEDTTLVPESMFGFPSLELDLSGISGNVLQARDAEGHKLALIFINSDTLFATGSSDLSDPARENFQAIAQLIQSQWPDAPIRVRGHTDATGDAATNQALSEARAAAAAESLAAQGIDASRLSSTGLGSSIRIVLETNPDGSDNPTGRQYNRRVEIIVTIA